MGVGKRVANRGRGGEGGTFGGVGGFRPGGRWEGQKWKSSQGELRTFMGLNGLPDH